MSEGLLPIKLNRWVLPLVTSCALIPGQGPIQIFGTGVFMKPIAEELGFGRGDISTAIALCNLAVAIAVPFFGKVVDSYGVRIPELVSIALFALTTAALSLLSSSMSMLVLLYVVSGIAAVGQTPTGYSKVLSTWFDRERGLALGICLAGTGLGTALMPQISGFLLVHFGWRTGFIGLGITIMVMAFLPVMFFLREPLIGNNSQTAGSPSIGLTLGEAMRGWRYWVLIGAFFICGTTINGSMVHVAALLTDRGIPVAEAVTIVSASGFALFFGRVVTGFIMDRIFVPYVAVFFMILPLIGIWILGSGTNLVSPVIGTILLGVGIGAEFDIMSFIISRYFGLRAFGALMGTTTAAFLLGTSTGASMLGWSHQMLHSYNPGFVVDSVLMVTACVLFLIIGPYRYPAGAIPIDKLAANNA